MKKIIALFITLSLGFIINSSAIAENITIVGTGSGSSILQSIGDVFCRNNLGVSIIVPKSIGSGGGIKAVGTDQSVMGRVARNIKDSEQPYGLTYFPYSKNPIVFFLNKAAGIKALSAQQICDIYSGKVTNWNAVGGKDIKIRVVRREEGDSSLSILLKTLPGFKDITITSKSKTTYSNPDTCQLVAKKEGTIAFGAYADAKTVDVDIPKINGNYPADSDYPYFGMCALIFKEKNKTGIIGEFVDFAISFDAHEAIKSAGGIPL